MALNHVIRRTVSQSVPIAVRLIGGSQRCNRNYSSLFAALNQSHCLNEKLFRSSLPSTLHHYSSPPSSDESLITSPPPSDKSLIRILDSEIECAQEDASQEAEVPDNFPFKIEDNPGLQTVTLTRKYQDETISVEVHMTSLEEEGDDVDDNEEEEKGSPSHLSLVVRITKGHGPCLEIGCTAYPDEITIDTLSVKNQDDSEDQIAYEGPDFMDLDENLQKAFHKYLEIRGIRPSNTNFLHEYMINKDAKEYMNWLQNIKKFVQA